MATSKIVCRKMIKPSSPTPPSLRCHNLSFTDYINPHQYIPIASFYSMPQHCNITQISHILENSLSKVLTSYYPFAGQIKDNNTYVDCDDTGAEYFNVRISCPMSDILNHPYNDVVDVVFPQDLPWSDTLNRTPLVIQLSHFDCGGIAVSACLSHKIADAYSLSRFLNDWASTARDDQLDFKPSTQFNGALYFPIMNDNPPAIPKIIAVSSVDKPQGHVSRMYNFSSSSLKRLKADIVATSSGVVQNPTRVEVVSALIHKCGALVSKEKNGVFKPSILVHAVNVRPPIPSNTVGNASSLFGTMALTEDSITLPNFVAQLQMAKQQFRDEIKDMTTNQVATITLAKLNQGPELQGQDMFDFYYCSSYCHFGSYAIDFGWGKPIRVTPAKNPMKNYVICMDDSSGEGINVLITLPEDDMLMFQSNKELLQFASPLGHTICV